ncbi:FERM domain-containing protein 5 [Homalodisca vitripennis]|nr:FERM domain-containing protein 5 [Homalodisca vitripennis]
MFKRRKENRDKGSGDLLWCNILGVLRKRAGPRPLALYLGLLLEQSLRWRGCINVVKPYQTHLLKYRYCIPLPYFCLYISTTSPQHKGKFLVEHVCRQLNLIEKDYFGLRYVDSTRQRQYGLYVHEMIVRTSCINQHPSEEGANEGHWRG